MPVQSCNGGGGGDGHVPLVVVVHLRLDAVVERRLLVPGPRARQSFVSGGHFNRFRLLCLHVRPRPLG